MLIFKNTHKIFNVFLFLSLFFFSTLFHNISVFPRCGDVDGDGNIYSNDVLLVARASIGMVTFTEAQRKRADVVVSASDTPDGNIYSNDLLIVARASLGMVTPLCNECTSHASQVCYNGDVYWYDSCNKKEELVQYCSGGCSNGQCASISGTDAAAPKIDAARNILFNQSDGYLSAIEFASAEQYLNEAIAVSQNNGEANFLLAFTKILREGDRIASITDPTLWTKMSIFPIKSVVIDQVGARIVERISPFNILQENTLQSLMNVDSGRTTARKAALLTETSQWESFKTEIDALLSIVGTVASYLSKTESYFSSNSSIEGIRIPKDIFNPTLGSYYIDLADIKLLIGTLEFIKFFLNYATAYNAEDGSFNYGGPYTDKNGDGKFGPEDYLPPTPFGTLTSDGSTRLTNAKSSFNTAIDKLIEATNLTLSEIPNANDLTYVTSGNEDYSAAVALKNVLLQFKELFNITVSQSPNLSDILQIDLGALFKPINDLKSLAPTFTDANLKCVVKDLQGIPTVPDKTFNGLIPKGIDNSAWMYIDSCLHDLCFDTRGNPITNITCPLYKAAQNTTTGTIASVTGLSTLLNNPDGSITEAEFSQAKSQIASYLSSNPNSADANLAAFLVKLAEEAEILTYRYDESSIFPLSISGSGGMARITQRILDFNNPASYALNKLLQGGLPRISDTVQPASNPPKVSEVIEDLKRFAETGGTADVLIAYLQKAKTYAAANPSYHFDAKFKIEGATSSWYFIDEADIILLEAAITMLKGWGLSQLAYNWNCDSIFWLPSIVEDGTDITPDEYLPSTTECPNYGKLVNSSYPSQAKILFLSSLDLIKTAASKTAAEGTDNNELIPYNSDIEVRAIVDAADNTADALKALFNGVTLTVPLEPWETGSGYDSKKTYVAIRVNFSALSDTPIQDWRALMPTLKTNGDVTFPDKTFGGLFPTELPPMNIFEEKGTLYVKVLDASNSYSAVASAIVSVATLSGTTASNGELKISGAVINTLTGTLVKVEYGGKTYYKRMEELSYKTYTWTCYSWGGCSSVPVEYPITISINKPAAKKLSAPTQLKVTATDNGAVTLTWSPPTTYADGTTLYWASIDYKIYRSTAQGGPFTLVNQVLKQSFSYYYSGSQTVEYRDGGLTNGTIYYYYVTAKYSDAGESLPSTTITAAPTYDKVTIRNLIDTIYKTYNDRDATTLTSYMGTNFISEGKNKTAQLTEFQDSWAKCTVTTSDVLSISVGEISSNFATATIKNKWNEVCNGVSEGGTGFDKWKLEKENGTWKWIGNQEKVDLDWWIQKGKDYPAGTVWTYDFCSSFKETTTYPVSSAVVTSSKFSEGTLSYTKQTGSSKWQIANFCKSVSGHAIGNTYNLTVNFTNGTSDTYIFTVKSLPPDVTAVITTTPAILSSGILSIPSGTTNVPLTVSFYGNTNDVGRWGVYLGKDTFSYWSGQPLSTTSINIPTTGMPSGSSNAMYSHVQIFSLDWHANTLYRWNTVYGQ